MKNNNGPFQKKSEQGALRIYLFEKPPRIFHFLLYPWKFQTKQS